MKKVLKMLFCIVFAILAFIAYMLYLLPDNVNIPTEYLEYLWVKLKEFTIWWLFNENN